MNARFVGLFLAAALLVTLGLMGCSPCPVETPTVAPPKPVKAVKRDEPCICPVITREADKIRAACASPTGHVQTGVILIEKISPANVLLGQPFTYDIVVKNLTPCTLNDVVVTDHVPSNLEFKKADPKETSFQGGDLKWILGQLKGNESRTIHVTVEPKTLGPMSLCADVVYRTEVCLPVVVEQPKLQLVKTAPAEVLVCDPIPTKLVVTNTGTGVAKAVKIKDVVPDGMLTMDGKRTVEFDAGDIAAGQSKEFALVLKAERTGKFENKASATGFPGLTADAASTTQVRQPILEVTKTASHQKVYLGQNLTYTITVTNKGDAPAKDTVLKDVIPAGASFKSASDGGQLSQNAVVWNLGMIAPNGSKKVTLTVRGDEISRVTNTATAEAVCAKPVSASVPTEIAGIPAVLLEVIDVEDPVPVGGEVTYVIQATNQGSAIGRNVKIVAAFEPNHQYVSCIGATHGTHDTTTNTVTFDPFPGLLPKAKAQWRITVKAVKAGDVRIKVTMTTDMTTRPVEETEATNFYE